MRVPLTRDRARNPLAPLRFGRMLPNRSLRFWAESGAGSDPLPIVRSTAPESGGPRTADGRATRSAGTAWSAGLRPASRGSAKPAPMALHRSEGKARDLFHGRRGVPEDPIVGVSPDGGLQASTVPRRGVKRIAASPKREFGGRFPPGCRKTSPRSRSHRPWARTRSGSTIRRAHSSRRRRAGWPCAPSAGTRTGFGAGGWNGAAGREF